MNQNTGFILPHSSKKDNIEDLKQSIAYGFDINSKDADGKSYLHHAVLNNQFEIVQFLIENHLDILDINAQDDWGRTAIFHAMSKWNSALITLLLDNGADPLIQNQEGMNAAHEAMWSNHIKAFQTLLDYYKKKGEAETILDSLDSDGKSILWHAVNSLSHHKYDYVNIILDHGVDVNQYDNLGERVICSAFKKKDMDMVKLLHKRGASLDISIDKNKHAILVVTRNSSRKLAIFLMENNIDQGVCDKSGKTCFHHAVLNHDLPMLTTLLTGSLEDFDTDSSPPYCLFIDIQDDEGLSPLALAAHIGFVDLVDILVAFGADINIKDKRGFTPLRIAMMRGHNEMARKLFESGARPENSDIHDREFLYYPMSKMDPDLIHKMIEIFRPDINMRNAEGKTPLQAACISGELIKIDILLSLQAHVNSLDQSHRTALHDAMANGYVEAGRKLIENFAYVDPCDKNGRTPFLDAVEGNYIKAVIFLEEQEINIHALDINHDNALHLAARKADLHMIRHLIKKGIDVEAKNKDGMTPLDIAKAHDGDIDYRIVKELDFAIRAKKRKRRLENNKKQKKHHVQKQHHQDNYLIESDIS